MLINIKNIFFLQNWSTFYQPDNLFQDNGFAVSTFPQFSTHSIYSFHWKVLFIYCDSKFITNEKYAQQQELPRNYTLIYLPKNTYAHNCRCSRLPGRQAEVDDSTEQSFSSIHHIPFHGKFSLDPRACYDIFLSFVVSILLFGFVVCCLWDVYSCLFVGVSHSAQRATPLCTVSLHTKQSPQCCPICSAVSTRFRRFIRNDSDSC